jgi:hypothetical protein
MTTARTDPVRAAIPDVPEDDVEVHVYSWYDPDAAAFDMPDPLADLEPLSDQDVVAIADRS